jgi:DNA-binding response OmpR family regulator
MTSATVLLISAEPADEAKVRGALESIRGQPYRLDVAATLADGLARIRQGHVDAIMLDLNLPDNLGLTTFLRVQPKATQLPIIVLVNQQDEPCTKPKMK